MTATMRAKNSGSYDRGTKCWRVKGKGLHATIKQLQERYKVKFTATEPGKLQTQSSPYWRRYLQDCEHNAVEARRDAEAAAAFAPLRLRIAGMIDRLRGQTDAHDLAERLTAILDIAPTPTNFGKLGSVESFAQAAPDDPSKITVSTEVEFTLQRLAAKHKNAAYYQARQALEMLTQVAGNLEPAALTVDYWRTFFTMVKANPTWGLTTQHNVIRHAKQFLETVAQERGVNYTFLRSKSFVINPGEGQKVKYTEAEVRTALQHAAGLPGLQLLLGLNCGMYAGDILALTTANIKGEYIVWKRAKLGLNAPTLRHKLWATTLKALQEYDFKASNFQLQDGFTRFRQLHKVPEHKALRKTMTELIKHNAGDPVARMFRGEIPSDTHNRNYVSKSLGKIEQTQLDSATDDIATMFGL